jgi:uncharacterized protein (TIGR03118 family)
MIRYLSALFLIAACDAGPETATTESALGGKMIGGGGASLRLQEHDLCADLPKVAANTEPLLVNAWGVAVEPDGEDGPEFWVSAADSDSVVIMDAAGVPSGEVVSVTGGPTGAVYTEEPDFLGDEFIFVTEGGTIAGWQRSLGERTQVRVDDSEEGAGYKGAAILDGHDLQLAVTDFRNAAVEVYGAGYAEVEGAGFEDPEIPAGFAPFNIAQLGGEVYVTYAMQDETGEDDVAGPGLGYVDVFRLDGSLDRRLIAGGHLDAPWGLAMGPPSWGKMSNKLLVGNFGDGAINVYEPDSGVWLGRLRHVNGVPISIDGLWAIMVGPKGDRLYFTAGPEDEEHGLFGTLELTR